MIASEFVELAAVVVALYVSELVVYLPPGRAALIVRGKRVRMLRGFGLLSPFPWSRRYDVDDFHLQYGSTSVVAYAPHRIDSRKPLGHGAVTVNYADIVIVDIKEKTVRINAKDLFVAPSASAAYRAKRELDEVRNAADKKRSIRDIVVRTLDPKGVAEVAKKDTKALYPLVLATTLHLMSVIAVTSALVFNQVGRWQYLVGLLATTWLYAILRFYRAHKALRPEARSERRTRTLMYFLSPVGVIKAVDFITKERLADHHWLAALEALGSDEQAQTALRTTKHELDHPGDRTWTSDDPSAKAAQVEFRALVSEILAPRVKEVVHAKDDEIVVRCPACGAGYTKLVTKCFDCGAAIPAPPSHA